MTRLIPAATFLAAALTGAPAGAATSPADGAHAAAAAPHRFVTPPEPASASFRRLLAHTPTASAWTRPAATANDPLVAHLAAALAQPPSRP